MIATPAKCIATADEYHEVEHSKMALRHVHVFSNDPLLASYLASYLQGETCNIQEEDGKFYLRSSYFEKLPLLSTSAKRKRCSPGLASVLDLMSPAFDTLPISQKREACIRALLFIFNGALKLKYKNCGGLMRQIIAPPVVVEQGSDYEEDGAGKRVYTSFRSIPIRFVLTAGNDFFRQADRKQPSIKKIWNTARRNASVARALYHYEKSEELVELRKVIEEIMNDTFTGTRPKKGNVPFGEWNKQKWTEPEISAVKMEEVYALLHNTLLLGEQALHSLAFADRTQANKFTTSGPAMPLPEARDVVHAILMKWVRLK
jgi:hypothetical protein